MAKFLQHEITEGLTKLKRCNEPLVERQIDISHLQATEASAAKDNEIRDYFFSSSVDAWYDSMPQYTFKSCFVPIEESEARYIANNWNGHEGRVQDDVFVVPESLVKLAEKIDKVILESFPLGEGEGVFIKLSTRSPKDSKSMFKRAVNAYRHRLDANGNINDDVSALSCQYNARLVALSNEVAKIHCLVHNGREAVSILLDSHRVAEDLLFALNDETGKEIVPLSLVIRGWDPKIVPKCEYRAFVWDYKMNAIGQYWHSLYYPDLVDVKDEVASDCLLFFEKIKATLPVPNAMLDLAWLGPGNVILIEVNPLMEGLGSFKGSTGLFDFYDDCDVLTGKAPFEIRVRTCVEDRVSLYKHMSTDWRDVVFSK